MRDSQLNGIMERFHGTLVLMFQKLSSSRGNWCEVLLLALYFVRLVPSKATGMSPYLITHGWKPTSPCQVLFEGWMSEELGELDVAQ